MRCIGNEKGVALVTSLMFTALALVISMLLLYMVTSGIRSSAALKRYRTTMDAAYGGTEIMVKDIINASFGFNDYSSAHPGASYTAYLTTAMGSLGSNATVSDCLKQRLTLPRSQWSGVCANVNLNPKNGSDVSFQLNATSGTPYRVYSKIIDTMERNFLVLDPVVGQKTVVMAGNSDTSTVVLEGGSTTEGGGTTVPHYPYVYRIEIQGEREQNPLEKANISVMYAY